MPTIVGILTFINKINYRRWQSEPEISINFCYFSNYELLKFMINWVDHEKSFITLEPDEFIC